MQQDKDTQEKEHTGENDSVDERSAFELDEHSQQHNENLSGNPTKNMEMDMEMEMEPTGGSVVSPLSPESSVSFMTLRQGSKKAGYHFLRIILRKFVFQKVKFIPEGKEGRPMLEYNTQPGSLCHLIMRNCRFANVAEGKQWWDNSSEYIRSGISDVRNNAVKKMENAFKSKFREQTER